MDAVEILKLRLSGAIPRNLTVMEEAELIRRLEAQGSARQARDDRTSLIHQFVSEPVPAVAKPEPRMIVPAVSGPRDRPVIDCSAPPFIPDGWEVRPEDQIASAFRGLLVWTPGCVRLHVAYYGQREGCVRGFNLKRKLEGQPVLPANVLDWQFEDPDNRIPGSWSGGYVVYWGSVFRDGHGDPCVCVLCRRDDRWSRGFHWLDDDWRVDWPAAVKQVQISSRISILSRIDLCDL